MAIWSFLHCIYIQRKIFTHINLTTFPFVQMFKCLITFRRTSLLQRNLFQCSYSREILVKMAHWMLVTLAVDCPHVIGHTLCIASTTIGNIFKFKDLQTLQVIQRNYTLMVDIKLIWRHTYELKINLITENLYVMSVTMHSGHRWIQFTILALRLVVLYDEFTIFW